MFFIFSTSLANLWPFKCLTISLSQWGQSRDGQKRLAFRKYPWTVCSKIVLHTPTFQLWCTHIPDHIRTYRYNSDLIIRSVSLCFWLTFSVERTKENPKCQRQLVNWALSWFVRGISPPSLFFFCPDWPSIHSLLSPKYKGPSWSWPLAFSLIKLMIETGRRRYNKTISLSFMYVFCKSWTKYYNHYRTKYYYHHYHQSVL